MKQIPRISLAQLPTPIEKLHKISNKLGKEIYIWRDDLNGFMESGNKLRKLEFLLADAQAQGCNWVITCGGPQSNHTRATSIVARKLGMEVSILTLPKPGYNRTQLSTGNLLINEIFDSEMIWLDFDEYQKQGATYEPFLQREADRVRALGKKPYVIPLGGSNAMGCQGYRAGISEMLTTWKKIAASSAPEHLFCALGSGGTFVGLQWGLQENKAVTKLHGINVIGPIETAQKYVSALHASLQKEDVIIDTSKSQQIDGYVGAGYSIASDEDLRFYIDLARIEGIMLDPCYTGKAFRGMVSEIEKHPSSFGGKILFLHSGGIFGNFAYASQFEKALKGNASS